MKTHQFASLQHTPHLRHALTTRNGGSSHAPFASLNLGFHVGDDAARVCDNRRTMAQTLGFKKESLVAAQQTHGALSHVVTRNDCGRGALDWDSAFSETDALIVGETDVPLLILVADCAPLLMVDARHHVLAVVHAGWRGAVAGIASQTVTRMNHEFDSQPRDIQVGIGPCLCLDCFEIGEEVAKEAKSFGAEVMVENVEREKPHLDLRALLNLDLKRAGVHLENVEAMPDCPHCDLRTWFSHRGEEGKTGRFGIVAWWK